MATVYLNSVTGNDSNTYAQAQDPSTPWLTFGKVNTSATTGDTVSVAAGTYNFATVAWSTAKVFTIVGAALVNGMPTTILDGASASRQWTGLSATWNISNIMFQNIIGADNITILKTNTTNTTIITFTNCVFKLIQVDGTTSEGGVFGTLGSGTNATTINLVSCLFIDLQRVAGKTGYVLYCRGGGNNTFTINVTSCTLYFLTAGTSVVNNIFKMYSDPGTGNLNLTIKNTIVYNATGLTLTSHTLQVTGGSGVATSTRTYSDYYLVTGATAGTGNIITDPLFIDAPNANFNLRPTSPCIGSGSL